MIHSSDNLESILLPMLYIRYRTDTREHLAIAQYLNVRKNWINYKDKIAVFLLR